MSIDAISPRPEAEFRAVFERQLNHASAAGKTTATQRIRMLRKLEGTLLAWRPRIQQALLLDFGKPSQEVDLVEIYYVLREIRHARRHLRSWMRPRRVPTPLAFIGARSYVTCQPKGVCLIISPWNYPVNLTLGPLVSAIAAGCTAIIKPSEYTPHTGALMKELLATVFPEDHVCVVEGDADTAQALLSLPFHHIFFTGSPSVGKIVMEAAARNLTSVTLELGGKCPAIVDRTASVSSTARRIVQTKFINAGQTCVAPDYVLVHETLHNDLVETIHRELQLSFPAQQVLETDYCGLIHDRHLKRMQDFLSEAVAHGAQIVHGGTLLQGRKLMPTLLTSVPLHARVMQEEIFGPLLPIIAYSTTREAIEIVQSLPRPLGLYVFGHGMVTRDIVRQTHSGGVCINHCALNYYNSDLPFGGIGQSGFGKSHGYDGFLAFSNVRGVFRQHWAFSPLDWLFAPYTKAKERLIDFTLRWL